LLFLKTNLTSLCRASSLRLHVAELASAAFLLRASSASAAEHATRAECANAASAAESEAWPSVSACAARTAARVASWSRL